MAGPFGALYRLDAALDEWLPSVGTRYVVAGFHVTIYWVLIGLAAWIGQLFWPSWSVPIWLADNWIWLPIPVEFAYLIYSLCRGVLEAKTSVPHPD
jgi:hypothetical protein